MTYFIFKKKPLEWFWHPKGWTIFRILEDYIREKLRISGYEEIKTPEVVDRKLYGKNQAIGINTEKICT